MTYYPAKICPSCKSEFGGGEIFCPNDGARLSTGSQLDTGPQKPGDDPMIGVVLNERYKILRRIGEGGMGLVYEAEHVAIEKRVALKILRDDYSSRPEVVERFKQEAKSASKIGNDHIVDISDFGRTPSGASYFVMELLQGEDLAELLEREVTLPIARAADILLQCCKALSAAHAKGIVHRDMKPENIYLTERDGRSDFVKIVDFGIAKMSDVETPGAPGRKLTKTGMIFGTPEYMSPEQAAGKNLDHRVDIYALAVILFETVTGKVPFIGDTFMGILTQHMFEDPPALRDVNPKADVSDAISTFIYRGLAKEAEARYQSCDEMAAALTEALQGRIVSGATQFGYAEPARRARENARTVAPEEPTELVAPKPGARTGLIVGLAVGLAAAIGAGVVLYIGSQPTDGTDPTAGNDVTDAGAALVIGEPPHPTDAGGPVAPPVVDAGPAMVLVSVNTSPSGARLFVEDRGEVCDATPCSFETTPGEAITVRASRGRTQGEAQLSPTENTTIQLEMHRVAPTGGGGGGRRSGGGRSGGGQSGGGGGGGGGSGDLKIPDIFRTPR